MKQVDVKRCLKLVLSLFILIVVWSCSEDDKPKTTPKVTTLAATDIAATSAKGGGEITSDGNANIISSGLVYSSTNTLPTIEDDSTKTSVTDGAFISLMDGLESSKEYYFRAYAINSKGIGYGEALSFSTGNAAPTAVNLSVSGSIEVNKTLTAVYTYSDVENDPQGTSTIQWYVANDNLGTGEVAIAGATAGTFLVEAAQQNKFIRFGITPKATAGSLSGVEVKSAFTTAVVEATTVTFMYNNQSVTYGIIISSVTGRRWLDRNLGAPGMASAADDFPNKGDLFQWGRDDDGHQLVNRAASTGGTTAVNGTVTTLSTTDSPGHNKFIVTSAAPDNWRSPVNNSLWQPSGQVNNPCPTGWHIPTKDEWLAENLSQSFTQIYDQLKLTTTGSRGNNGAFFGTLGGGLYWTSTVVNGSEQSSYIGFYGENAAPDFYNAVRAEAYSCKCIKD